MNLELKVEDKLKEENISNLTQNSKEVTDEKIEKSITNANIRQCSSCKAMKHVLKAEEEEKK